MDILEMKHFTVFPVLENTTANGVVTNGGQGCEPPPWKAKCSNRVPLSLYFSMQYSFGFQCFFVFRSVSGDFGFQYSHSHRDSPSWPYYYFFLTVDQ